MKSIFQTSGYFGCSVKFSPFIANLFACASSQSYGLTGCGALYVLDHFQEDISNPIKCFRCFYWPHDRLLDVTWSEDKENILWSASGDGYIQIWDLNAYASALDPLSEFEPSPDPIRTIKAHQKEITSIEWGKSRAESPLVLTTSCDKTVKLWDATSSVLLSTFKHQSQADASCWSPSSCFASAFSDGFVRIYSLKESPDKPSFELKSCSSELLTCDWSKINPNVVISGSHNGNITGWDIRAPNGPLFVIQGHKKPIKKVKFSPHMESTIASVSYDNATKLWDYTKSDLGSGPLCVKFQHHSDSVCGVDFNAQIRDEIVDCGYDQLVYLYSINSSFGVRSH